jgi:hypothetical protein
MKQTIQLDPANRPMPGNRLSPVQQYNAIRQDEFTAKSRSLDRDAAKERLKADALRGRYVSDVEDEEGLPMGDMGQFLETPKTYLRPKEQQMKTGGNVKGYAKGGKVSSASNRADGCAQRGKTKGRFV